MNGIDVLKQLRRIGNGTPFVFLTMSAEPSLAALAMRAGGSAYVLKYAAGEDLIVATRQVLAGGTYVTPSLGARFVRNQTRNMYQFTAKQREVLRLVSSGLRSKQIADQLNLSVRTVEAHKYAMMQIVGAHSAIELVRRSEEFGLLL